MVEFPDIWSIRKSFESLVGYISFPMGPTYSNLRLPIFNPLWDLISSTWLYWFSLLLLRLFIGLPKQADFGGFHLVAKIIRELKSHMVPYKFKCSHWLKLQHSDWRANLVKDFFFYKLIFYRWEYLNLSSLMIFATTWKKNPGLMIESLCPTPHTFRCPCNHCFMVGGPHLSFRFVYFACSG